LRPPIRAASDCLHGKHIWRRLFAKSEGNDEQVRIAATLGHWLAFEYGAIVLVGDPAEEGSDESELIDTERELLGLALSLLWDVRHERRDLISSPLPRTFFSEALTAFPYPSSPLALNGCKAVRHTSRAQGSDRSL
jgi:hypothetical protein